MLQKNIPKIRNNKIWSLIKEKANKKKSYVKNKKNVE